MVTAASGSPRFSIMRRSRSAVTASTAVPTQQSSLSIMPMMSPWEMSSPRNFVLRTA